MNYRGVDLPEYEEKEVIGVIRIFGKLYDRLSRLHGECEACFKHDLEGIVDGTVKVLDTSISSESKNSEKRKAELTKKLINAAYDPEKLIFNDIDYAWVALKEEVVKK